MADAEARLTHVDVWPEHLLSALLRAHTPDTVEILRSLEIDDRRLRARLTERAAASPRPTGETLRHSEAVRRVLERAEREAEAQRFTHVEPRHILLALVEEDEGLMQSLLRVQSAGRRAARGPRVRFHSVASMPDMDRGMEDEIDRTRREKEAAIEAREFERAANLRDEERRMTNQLRELRQQFATRHPMASSRVSLTPAASLAISVASGAGWGPQSEQLLLSIAVQDQGRGRAVLEAAGIPGSALRDAVARVSTPESGPAD